MAFARFARDLRSSPKKLTNGEYHAIGVNALADWECHAIGVNALVNLGTPFDRGLIPWRTGSMPLTPTGFFVVQKTNDRSLFDRFDGHNSQCMGG